MSCAIIDVQLGIERVFGAADLWRRAITMLMTELPGALADIERAFAEEKIEDLRRHAHKLHGTLIYCGTPMLQRAAKALELACAKTPEQIEERLSELKMAVAALDAFVEKYGIPDVRSLS